MSITYEVTATVREDLVKAYEDFMLNTHIPDLLATGIFERASFSSNGRGVYRIRYETEDIEVLDRYLSQHATALREDFARAFPEGITVERDIWMLLETFSGSTNP